MLIGNFKSYLIQSLWICCMRLSFCLKHWSEMYWNAYKFVLKCVNKNFLYIAVEVGNWNIKKTKIIWDSNLVRIFSWWKREVKMNCEWITKILSSVSNRVSAENRGDHRNRKIEIEPLDGKTYLSIQLSRGEFGHVAMKKKTYSLTDSGRKQKKEESGFWWKRLQRMHCFSPFCAFHGYSKLSVIIPFRFSYLHIFLSLSFSLSLLRFNITLFTLSWSFLFPSFSLTFSFLFLSLRLSFSFFLFCF